MTLTNNAAFGKNTKNVRKHRDIKVVITEKRRLYLLSEPNYHIPNFFSENLIAIQTRKTEIFMNKPVYLELLILEFSKIVMCESWDDYVKPKYCEKAKLRYTDAESFILYA